MPQPQDHFLIFYATKYLYLKIKCITVSSKNINIDNIRNVSPIQHNNSEASNYTKDWSNDDDYSDYSSERYAYIYTYMINKL